MNEKTRIVIFNNQELTNQNEKSKPIKQPLRKYLERDYINQSINQMPSGKPKMVILTLWLTGIRETELINIKKGDIDFTNNMMRIKWLKNRKYYERIIPIRHELKNILELYTNNMKSDEKIFPFSRQWIYLITKKYLGVSPHKIRHSFAVNLLRQETNIITIKQLMGHKSINTTTEYLKIVPNDLAKELEKIKF